jgi:hypothetical protein
MAQITINDTNHRQIGANDSICNEIMMSEYKFYSRGDYDSRFDSYIDEYVVLPSGHRLIKNPETIILSGITAYFIGNNTYHWWRYYSHSCDILRQRIYQYLLK